MMTMKNAIVSLMMAAGLSAPAMAADKAARTAVIERKSVASLPLSYEVALSGKLSQSEATTSYEDPNDEYTDKDRTMIVSASVLRILGDFEIGPSLRYYRDDSKTTYKDPDSKSSAYTYLIWGAGVSAKYNFAGIQTESVVPYLSADFSRDLASFSSIHAENDMGFGLGLSVFLARNVAVNTTLRYGQGETRYAQQGRYTKARTEKENELALAWGFSTFL
jgi:opacity protein-like surface antigen